MRVERIQKIEPVHNEFYSNAKQDMNREEEKQRETPAAILSISKDSIKKNNETYIYCMEFRDDNYRESLVKIGISNNIKRRIRELNGSEIVKRYWYSVPLDRGEAMFLEKLIHTYLRETWDDGIGVPGHGEYFSMDLDEAIKVVRTFTEGKGSDVIEYA